ncbi:MAG: alpha/beta fold hydrolase [Micromonosporaceae bacterium]|nr:alpha/beta fold hydrolase [Micromonosporaceae bacterium]
MQQLKLLSLDGIRLDAAVHEPAGGRSRGTVLLVHGITADLDEGGMFVRLAERLAQVGFTALRFSFRGHGRSGGTQRGATIAGEMLDVEAVIEYVTAGHPGQVSVVAASFGAVPAVLSLPDLEGLVSRLVLWNPVLDLRATFVEPELPWGKHNYSPAQQELLASQGFLLVDGEFALGRVMFDEFRHYRPDRRFVASDLPALVVHGDQDSSVSYEIARAAAAAKPNCAFHTIAGSDHGFDSREREDEAIAVTVTWLDGEHPEEG